MTENDIFEELMASVQEMDDIIKGQTQLNGKIIIPWVYLAALSFQKKKRKDKNNG